MIALITKRATGYDGHSGFFHQKFGQNKAVHAGRGNIRKCIKGSFRFFELEIGYFVESFVNKITTLFKFGDHFFYAVLWAR